MSELERIEREKLRWACRRGMLELDLFLVPFFEKAYDGLSHDEKGHFSAMLCHTDPELFAWLMGHDKAARPELQSLTAKIREFRRQNNDTAL